MDSQPPDHWLPRFHFRSAHIRSGEPMTNDNLINNIRTNLRSTQAQLRLADPKQRQELLKACRDLNLELSRVTHSPRIDYHQYIKSGVWKEKAMDAKERADYRCQICNTAGNNSTLHAHHRTYERLGNERPEDITVLCAGCHETFHDKGQVNGN